MEEKICFALLSNTGQGQEDEANENGICRALRANIEYNDIDNFHSTRVT